MSNDLRDERPPNTDRLTGVHNARSLHEALTREVTYAENHQDSPLTMLMLDIDHMMRVNHTHGYQAGDKVLQFVANILRSSVRPQDSVFRFGGDEFALLLPGTDLEGGLCLGENIRNSIATSEGLAGQITVTIAVRQYRVGEGEHSFVAGVDEALYRQMNQRFRQEKGLLPLDSTQRPWDEISPLLCGEEAIRLQGERRELNKQLNAVWKTSDDDLPLELRKKIQEINIAHAVGRHQKDFPNFPEEAKQLWKEFLELSAEADKKFKHCLEIIKHHRKDKDQTLLPQ